MEQDLVDVTVVVDNVELGGREVQAPITQVSVNHVDSVIFIGRFEACTFKNFAQDPDSVDKVRERTEDGQGWEEGRVIVVLKCVRVRYILANMLTARKIGTEHYTGNVIEPERKQPMTG